MVNGNREIEIKLAVPGTAEAKRLLDAAGFRVSKPRVFEKNTLFDTSVSTLRNSSKALRVREAGGATKLTFKGPPEIGKYKSREELELEVSDADTITAILDRIEYQPVFRYEKFRTEYQQAEKTGTATLDETPIGVYLELEGDPSWIENTARQLGFAESTYITASYARLHFHWCEAQGIEPTNMLFA
jgi:adenylate cyclase class 2